MTIKTFFQGDAIISGTCGHISSYAPWPNPRDTAAADLFYLACLLSQPPTLKSDRRSPKAGPRLWLTILLSLVTVAISPMTSQRTFLPNVLVMYALLLIPLLLSRAAPMEGKLPAKPGHSATNEETEEKFSICQISLSRCPTDLCLHPYLDSVNDCQVFAIRVIRIPHHGGCLEGVAPA